MADPMKPTETSNAGASTPSSPTPRPIAPATVHVKLTPADHADHPIMANYTGIHVAPGIAYVDFGFLEPALLGALAREARAGKRVPAAVEGKLVARIAVGYDTLQTLHAHMQAILKGTARTASKGTRDQEA